MNNQRKHKKLQNYLYILEKIMHISPVYIWVSMIVAVICKLLPLTNILLIQKILDLVENSCDFSKIIGVLSVYLGIAILLTIISS